MITRHFVVSACLAITAFGSSVASAQQTPASNPASLQLGQCLVGKSGGEDWTLIKQWMAASIAMGSTMKDIVTVDPAAKRETDRRMAAMFERLMMQDCRSQMTALVKARDASGIQAASGMLGQMAIREMLRDPQTMQALIAHAAFMDPAMMQALEE